MLWPFILDDAINQSAILDEIIRITHNIQLPKELFNKMPSKMLKLSMLKRYYNKND